MIVGAGVLQRLLLTQAGFTRLPAVDVGLSNFQLEVETHLFEKRDTVVNAETAPSGI